MRQKMEINEIKAIADCQRGRLEEFGGLYEKYVRKIYDFIYFKTHHRETAEDLTSLTFTKALENIANFKTNKGSFSAWLYRIARNSVIDFYRTAKPNSNIDDVWDLSDGSNLACDFDAKEKLDRIKKYLTGFKPEQRDLFILKIWQGYSYKEIAQIMNKSEASLKMMLSRIMADLRKKMPLTLFIHLILLN